MNVDNQRKSFALALALAGVALFAGSASASLVIYEPFDYAQTEPINDGAYLGDGNQAGGLGLGTWSQVDNPGNVPPVNEADVADGGLSFTDGGGNALPVAGNAWVRRQRVGQIATSSPIDSGATTALTADNTTIWMTFLFQDLGFSGPDFGIGLASQTMVGNDNQSLSAAGVGVGFGINSTAGQDRNIGAVYYDNSTEFTRVTEDPATFNGPGASSVLLLAMKVEWNPAGTDDVISVYNVTDLTTEPTVALATATVDFSQAEQNTMNIFNISDTQVAFVDEIRVATTFAEAVGVPEPSVALLGALGGLLMLRRRRK
jgi:hypothetical protein